MSKQNKPIIRTELRKATKDTLGSKQKKTITDSKISKENGASTKNASSTKHKPIAAPGKPSSVQKPVVERSDKPSIQTDKTKVVKRIDSRSVTKVAVKTTPRVELKQVIKRTDSQLAAKTTAAPKTRTSIPLKASHTVKVPLKATHLQPVLKISQPPTQASKGVVPISTKNVMNQIHNVTVSSPPPIRRDVSVEQTSNENDAIGSSLRGRTRTRTLEKDEIVFLKDHHPPAIERTIVKSQAKSLDLPAESVNVEVKQPITFEVTFDEDKSSKLEARIEQQLTVVPKIDEPIEDEADDYEDDFDSYESDFESASMNSSRSRKSSTSAVSSSALGESSEDDTEGSEAHIAEMINATGSKAVLHKVEEEREHDSGAFDLRPPDSLHAFHNTSAKSDNEDGHLFDISSDAQNDSGIEYNLNPRSPRPKPQVRNNMIAASTMQNSGASVTERSQKNDIIKAPSMSPKIEAFYKRGNDLMKKISLDTMSYVLFDFKPIAYEQFMRIYGRSNTLQASAQTHNNVVNQEAQTDTTKVETAWTQCPVSYTVDHILSSEFADCKRGSGHIGTKLPKSANGKSRDMDDCIKILNSFDRKGSNIKEDSNKANVNHDDLNRFLQESLITISQINSRRDRHLRLKHSNMPQTDGFFSLKTSCVPELGQLQIAKIHGQPNLPNFLFSLHHSQSDGLSFITVWNVSEPDKPVCFLSSWSRIVCFEVHINMKGVVCAGLEDGSLAVWCFVEELCWHPKWTQNQKRYTPSQVVTPIMENTERAYSDFGKVVSIKSVYANVDIELLNGYNPTQLCSLHESGLLTLWTLMESQAFTIADINSTRIDHQSAWSRVKLTHSKTIDLRQSIETFVSKKVRKRPKSGFEKTKSYFNSDLFNDTALQELQENNQNEDKLLTKFCCVALELSADGVFVATNENFLLFGRKSFKTDAFRKIQIDDDPQLKRHATALVALPMQGDDIILAGLNDGSVKAFRFTNCALAADLPSEDDESIVSFSSLPSQQNPTTSSNNGNSFSELDNNNSLGKSCAIQNIVKGERQLQGEWLMLSQVDANEVRLPVFDGTGGAFGRGSDGSVHVMANLLNDQTVFNGSASKAKLNNVIERLIHLPIREQMVLLYGNQVKIYDLKSHLEILMSSDEFRDVRDVTTMLDDNNREYLIILGTNNNICVYLLTA